MVTSMNKENNNIIKTVRENVALFERFNKVYLFGSVLDESEFAGDVDLLLIYTIDLEQVVQEICKITIALEKVLGIPVDLTVLSVEEEKETEFLKRVSSRSLRLK